MKTLLCSSALVASLILAHAGEVGLRIPFGLTDDSNTKWDGTVSVSPGQVASISGWRFQQDDAVEGTTGWKASTRPLTVRRSNQAKNQAKKGAQQQKGKKKGKAAAAAAAANGPMADNGVILYLVGVTEDSVVSVKTAKGNFDFKLSDAPYGKVVEKLGGGVDIERTAARRPLT